MADREMSLKIPGDLISDLQGSGVTDVKKFLEGFFRSVQADELIDWTEDLEAEEESIANLYADEEEYLDNFDEDDDDDDDDDWFDDDDDSF